MTLSLKRNLAVPLPLAIYVKQFSIREELAQDLILEILLAPAIGSLPTQCLVLDGALLKENLSGYNRYLAGVPDEPDDNAVNSKIPYAAQSFYANNMHLSYTGTRAESMFNLTAIHDGATVKVSKDASEASILADPVLLVYSSLGVQKKMISEIFRILTIRT